LLDIRVGSELCTTKDEGHANYQVPHPLFAKIELRVQTDGEKTPKEAVVQCCRALVGELQILSKEFTKEYELRKLVSSGFNQ
jgi:DNA-directed RNA polymerase II subunit RPB11